MESSPKMILLSRQGETASGIPGPFGRPRKQRAGRQGFSFVELLVAVAIGAAVLGAAALCFHAIASSGRDRGTYENVVIGPQAAANFYSLNTDTRAVWFAPNPGLMVRSEQLRETFLNDVQKSSAVYCLPRSGLRYIHPSSFVLSGSYASTNFDFRRLDTSEAFRRFVVANGSPTASTYDDNPFSSGAVRGRNLTIMTVRSFTGSQMDFGPTYELDFVRVTNGRAGTFASLRRYAGTNRLTTADYYEVFYPDQKNGTVENSLDFFVAASFERGGRPSGTVPASHLVASNQPFYFVWWPDPIATELPSGTNYRTAMPDRTSYFMVVPMFPSL
jgi:prepilin-type N-terminal cleavage/methylation domain-containing protein